MPSQALNFKRKRVWMIQRVNALGWRAEFASHAVSIVLTPYMYISALLHSVEVASVHCLVFHVVDPFAAIFKGRERSIEFLFAIQQFELS